MGPRSLHFYQVPGDVDAAGQWTTLSSSGSKGLKSLVTFIIIKLQRPGVYFVFCACSSLGLSWSCGFDLGSVNGRPGGEWYQGYLSLLLSLFQCCWQWPWPSISSYHCAVPSSIASALSSLQESCVFSWPRRLWLLKACHYWLLYLLVGLWTLRTHLWQALFWEDSRCRSPGKNSAGKSDSRRYSLGKKNLMNGVDLGSDWGTEARIALEV